MMTNAIETPPLMKLSLAKAQLDTALDLFVRNKDPISVHALRAAVKEWPKRRERRPLRPTSDASSFPEVRQMRCEGPLRVSSRHTAGPCPRPAVPLKADIPVVDGRVR